MNEIKIGKSTVAINHFEPQTSPLGREFRLSSISRGSEEKWIAGTLKNDWVITFKYLDDDSFLKIRVGFNGQFLEKL